MTSGPCCSCWRLTVRCHVPTAPGGAGQLPASCTHPSSAHGSVSPGTPDSCCCLPPAGQLFNAMRSADAGRLIQYQFPTERLPAHTQVGGGSASSGAAQCMHPSTAACPTGRRNSTASCTAPI